MSVRAGGIDWVARWTEMEAAADAASTGHGLGPGRDRWSRRAARFDRTSRDREDDALALVESAVLADDVVADIGAGVGRHAIPLSRRCARVIAVEPSPAMRARMQARVDEANARNVETVEAAWPCKIPVVDVSLSAHVLYGVGDAARFVDEMTRTTRRTCLLVLGLRSPADALGALWHDIHGVTRPPRPAALEALALLHQLGRRASLRIVPGTERPLRFLPNDEDLNELCARLGIETDEPGRSRVRAALDRAHGREPDGGWGLGTSGPDAIIDWPGAAG